MKRKMIKLLALGLCVSFGLAMAACGDAATDEGADTSVYDEPETEDASESDDTADTSGEDADDSEEEMVLELEDGSQITLTALDSDTIGVYGYYTCAADGSEWAFGGNNLAVAYPDEEDGMNVYVCSLDFYQTEPDEEGTYYLCAVLNNTLDDVSTCWYVMNAVDDDGNTVGLLLQDPGNSEQYIALNIKGDSTDDSADGSSDAEDGSDSEDSADADDTADGE